MPQCRVRLGLRNTSNAQTLRMSGEQIRLQVAMQRYLPHYLVINSLINNDQLDNLLSSQIQIGL